MNFLESLAKQFAGKPIDWDELEETLIRADLDRVEQRLANLLDSREPLISEICHYLIDGAGKRLRPLFVMLAYHACGGSDRDRRSLS